jgi:hypothetical protein
LTNGNGRRPKKWFMLQMWRLQQVAAIGTLVLLILNLSLQLFGFVKWREPLNNPYFTIPLIAVLIAGAVWGFSIFWDLRLKMWRDQATVLVEKNPYTKEKMYSKEIAVYQLIYLPILEELGKNNPEMMKKAAALRTWLNKTAVEDPNTVNDLKEIFNYIEAKDQKIPGCDEKAD